MCYRIFSKTKVKIKFAAGHSEVYEHLIFRFPSKRREGKGKVFVLYITLFIGKFKTLYLENNAKHFRI